MQTWGMETGGALSGRGGEASPLGRVLPSLLCSWAGPARGTALLRARTERGPAGGVQIWTAVGSIRAPLGKQCGLCVPRCFLICEAGMLLVTGPLPGSS